jgi:addiction module HigA family antidote
MTVRNPAHPSAIVKTNLEAEGWSVNEFSVKLGISRNTVSRLLNSRCGISPTIALALERIGWSDADFWMRLQANYDLAQARRAMETTTGVGN